MPQWAVSLLVTAIVCITIIVCAHILADAGAFR